MSDILPTPEALARIQRMYRYGFPLVQYGVRHRHHFTASGQEHIPTSGPVLILSNHVAQLDALQLCWAARRPVILLAAASVVHADNLRARFLQSMGMVPKQKFLPDTRAIRQLKQWADLGAAVGLFPEGERSWDGQPLPLVRGIEKLVRLLGIPVITARIHNGDRQWPRWAERPRWGRVHIEFSPARVFDRKTPVSEIRQHLERGLTLHPDNNRRWPVWGRHLAQGLSNLIFLCPQCKQCDTLDEVKNILHCRNCKGRWRVDTTNTLHAIDRNASIAIHDAVAHLRGIIKQGWRMTEHGDNVLLHGHVSALWDRKPDPERSLGSGTLQLRRSGLFFNGEEQLEIPKEQIRLVTIEERRKLWILTADHILEPQLSSGSAVKWCWMIENLLRG